MVWVPPSPRRPHLDATTLYKIDSYNDWAAASPPTMVWVPAGLGPLCQGNGTTGPGKTHRRIKASPVRTHRRTKDMSQPFSVMVKINALGALPWLNFLVRHPLGYPFSGIRCGQTSTSLIVRLRNVGRSICGCNYAMWLV